MSKEFAEVWLIVVGIVALTLGIIFLPTIAFNALMFILAVGIIIGFVVTTFIAVVTLVEDRNDS